MEHNISIQCTIFQLLYKRDFPPLSFTGSDWAVNLTVLGYIQVLYGHLYSCCTFKVYLAVYSCYAKFVHVYMYPLSHFKNSD